MYLKIVFSLLSLFFYFGCTNTTPKMNNARTAVSAATNSFRNVKYIANFDGDTVTVDIAGIPDVFGHNIPVRIRHIDTPEMKSSNKCEKEIAIKAKNIVHDILKNAKQIDLEDVGRDKYFRILARMIADGKDVGEYLITQRLAYKYEGETKLKINWCIKN